MLIAFRPVKTPDPDRDPPRRPVFAPAEPGPRRFEEHEGDDLRYVSLPRRRSRGHGARNLAWGVALFVLALGLLGFGLYLAGPGAVYIVAVSLATAATLYVVARARLLRQRNGNFLAAAIVAMMAVAAVLVQQGWLRLIAARPSGDEATPATVASAGRAASSQSKEPTALVEDFPPSRAELESGQIAEFVKNFKVQYEGKTRLLRPGDILPVNSIARGQVKLGVLTDEITVPSDTVQIRNAEASQPEPPRTASRQSAREPAAREPGSRPPAKTVENGDDAQLTPKQLAEAVDASKREAARRYPALGVEDSEENLALRDAVSEMKVGGQRAFFNDPDWPVRLAEQLAQLYGWQDANGKRKEPRKQAPPAEDPFAPAAAPDSSGTEAPTTGQIDPDALKAPAPNRRAPEEQ